MQIMSSELKFRALCLGFFLTATGAAFAQSDVPVTPPTLTHVHGLAYSPDGKRLMLPSHHGLAVYANGRWSKLAGPQHDYMGFAATKDRLYSSGHPAPGSGLPNPFGLIRSRDGGKTWDKLGFEGQSDFHLLATGWNSNAIYVWNPQPSARLPANGLHLTLNEALEWRAAGAAGLAGAPQALAVHPDDSARVVVATSEGVYLSQDSGASFTRLGGKIDAYSVFFDLDGKRLWFGAFNGKARLAHAPIAGGRATEIGLPPLGRDAIAYIAQNPAARNEYAIATFARDVFLSPDGGRKWKQIARQGQVK